MQFGTSCGAVNLLISRASCNFTLVLIMYDKIITKAALRKYNKLERRKKGKFLYYMISNNLEENVHFSIKINFLKIK